MSTSLGSRGPGDRQDEGEVLADDDVVELVVDRILNRVQGGGECMIL